MPVLEDFLGSDGLDAKASTGLKALEKITTVSTLYSPVSCQYDGLDQALIQQCEALGDRTVILDTAFDDPHPTPWSCLISSYVSCYSPWIQITGPDSKDIMVPPGGFIAGLYARNDYVKGPDKLPVNEVLVGVTRRLAFARPSLIHQDNPSQNSGHWLRCGGVHDTVGFADVMDRSVQALY